MLLSGSAIDESDERGETITGDTLLVLLNAHHDEVPFTLPGLESEQYEWMRVFDTIKPRVCEKKLKGGAIYPLQGRSVAVFKMTPPQRERRRPADAAEQPQPETASAEQAEQVPAAPAS
jgi:glycogen operon protein